MALIDKFKRPIKDLRISVTDRCNFRCPYCMPAEIYGESYQFLPKNKILTFEEITRLTKIFVDLGVSRIRITGGEPLLRKDLPVLINQIASINNISDLSLTTNGYLLERLSQELVDSGLNRVTVSLDTLDQEVFKQMSGRNLDINKILTGIESASSKGLTPIKINCVVKRNVNEKSILGLINYFKNTQHIIRFIEYMDVGNLNKWDLSEVVSSKEILEIIKKDFSVQPLDASFKGEVATRYSYLSDDGIKGEIGIISSVTNPFCSSCTRARLTTDGKLVTCLFSNSGLDLKKEIRAGKNDKYIKEIITNYWEKRTDRYSELRSQKTSKNKKIEMYQLGG
ncbi:MAG: GTP 3',8-cyclase MoaA [SAR202 cluster bacterium]|nr:GTP 3',8-cyclase MoaA [SAR202 cluster bacterium]